MDTKHVAALLDALCERPLGDGRDMPSDELQALYRAALARAGNETGDASAGAGSDASGDAERLTAALAALWSSTDQETARRTVEAALMGSPAARLDAEAARAFLDAIEQSVQKAPTHLVDEVTAGAGRVATPGMTHHRPLVRTWSVRRWGLAAACAVLLVAGVSSWSVYGPRMEQPADLAPAQPAALESRSGASAPVAAPVNAAAPAPPPALTPAPPPAPAAALAPAQAPELAPAQAPALAATEPCEPRRADQSGVATALLQDKTAGEAKTRVAAEKSKREAPPADAPDCAAASGAGAGGVEAFKARAKAAAEEAAAARAPAKPGVAAPAASRAAPAEPPPPPSPPLGVR